MKAANPQAIRVVTRTINPAARRTDIPYQCPVQPIAKGGLLHVEIRHADLQNYLRVYEIEVRYLVCLDDIYFSSDDAGENVWWSPQIVERYIKRVK